MPRRSRPLVDAGPLTPAVKLPKPAQPPRTPRNIVLRPIQEPPMQRVQRRVRSQAEIADGMESDLHAARDGYNPNW